MKTRNTLIVCLILIVLGITAIWGVTYSRFQETYGQLTTAKSQVADLNDSNLKLTAENVALQKTANLKSFENTKALARFLKDAKSISEYKNDYASVACINLMREAKEKGYWLGITGINATNESIFSAMLRERKGIGQDVSWHVFNIAIVGDGDMYLVDTSDASYMFIVTVRGDFADYSGLTNGVTNLKLR